MNTLKFSHDYEKLPLIWKGTQATLISMTQVDINELKKSHPAFIKYDTKIRGEDKYFPLDFDEGLILTFIHHNTGIPFTTIRRFLPNKADYYHMAVLESFILKYNDGEERKKDGNNK